jgi:hypothetical protein
MLLPCLLCSGAQPAQEGLQQQQVLQAMQVCMCSSCCQCLWHHGRLLLSHLVAVTVTAAAAAASHRTLQVALQHQQQ